MTNENTWARRIKQDAHATAAESTVATIMAVPEAERNAFTAGRARMVGQDAAIESVITAVADMLRVAVRPRGKRDADGFNAGFNAARDQMMEELETLRAGLVAERPRGYRTHAAPESLLNVGEFVQALYHIWALHDERECRWDIETETCTVHPKHSSYTRQCQFDAATEFLRASGVDPDTDAIPDLMTEVLARRARTEKGKD